MIVGKILSAKILVAAAAVSVAGGGAGAVLVTHPYSSSCTTLSCILPQPGCQPPGSQPKFIAIMLQGIASYGLAQPGQTGGQGSFDAAATSYCASPNGQLPPDNPQVILRSMADGWLNYTYTPVTSNDLQPSAYSFDSNGQLTYPSQDDKDGPSRVVTGNGANTINDLATAGGYVLPFSYNGASMSGSAADPVFHFTAYTTEDVADDDPRYAEPPKLNAELQSIHRVFPDVPIVLIGHSNGGLIAEQWWLRYGTKVSMLGVAHVYSLDSPINGVGNAFFCSAAFQPCAGFGVSGAVADVYQSIWQGNVAEVASGGTSDPGEGDDHIEAVDSNGPFAGTYTAVGTYGDPLYDAGDRQLLHLLVPIQPGLGIASQIMLSDQCLQDESFTPLTDPQCALERNDFISPCDGGAYDESQPSSPQFPADRAYTGALYGLLLYGSVYIHSEAKDCPGTIQMIMNYVRTLPPKVPSPPANPSAAARAAWLATGTDQSNVEGDAFRHVASLLPSSDTAQIADLNQLAGIPLGGGLDENPPPVVAQAQAGIKALDQFFSTPGFTPAGANMQGEQCPGNCQSASPSPSSSSVVTPGHGSPRDAVDGFYQGELAGDWAAVCSYATPSAQALCLAGTSGQGAATGQVTVGPAVISGNEALASVTGSICAPSTPCVANSDPSLGMPPSPSQFAAFYQLAVANGSDGGSTVISPIPCSQVNGEWYVTFANE